MTRSRRLSQFTARLRHDKHGAALVEFALVAPIFLTLLMGALQVGIHVQNTNAIRNLASDAARYTLVEYQRGNKLTTSQVTQAILAKGVGPKYSLNSDRLAIAVTEPVSRIVGVREMQIRLTYDLPDYLAFVDTSAFQIVYTRPVFLLLT